MVSHLVGAGPCQGPVPALLRALRCFASPGPDQRGQQLLLHSVVARAGREQASTSSPASNAGTRAAETSPPSIQGRAAVMADNDLKNRLFATGNRSCLDRQSPNILGGMRLPSSGSGLKPRLQTLQSKSTPAFGAKGGASRTAAIMNRSMAKKSAAKVRTEIQRSSSAANLPPRALSAAGQTCKAEKALAVACDDERPLIVLFSLEDGPVTSGSKCSAQEGGAATREG